MGWQKSSVIEERLRFVVLANGQERRMKELCAEFGISRQTGYVWLKRYQEGGSGEMRDRSRRPLRSPKRTARELEQGIVELRQQWPDWGAAKLARVLGQQQPDSLLQPRTVHRILERYGLIELADRRQRAVKRFERSAPNELWQMDFKGPQRGQRGGAVGPLSVIDDHSRYVLALQHLGSTRLDGVRRTLTEIFQQAGLPEAMLMDHGTPWWNAASPWGFTELSIWIMRLGIRLTYSGICHPQTQGKVERMHGALQRAIRKRKADPENQQWLDGFRHEYNHLRPHEALQMATPASLWKPSTRAFPTHLTDWEYPPSAHCRLLGGDGQLGWYGRRWEISNALRGQLVGIEPIEDRAVVYFCRTPIRELDLKTGTATPVIGLPIRSLQG